MKLKFTNFLLFNAIPLLCYNIFFLISQINDLIYMFSHEHDYQTIHKVTE